MNSTLANVERTNSLINRKKPPAEPDSVWAEVGWAGSSYSWIWWSLSEYLKAHISFWHSFRHPVLQQPVNRECTGLPLPANGKVKLDSSLFTSCLEKDVQSQISARTRTHTHTLTHRVCISHVWNRCWGLYDVMMCVFVCTWLFCQTDWWFVVLLLALWQCVHL